MTAASSELVARAQVLSERWLGATSNRWQHVQAVGHRAAELAQVLAPEDRETVVAAAWLHDIGYAPALARTGLHALDGASYLREEGGWPSIIVQLVAHHSAAVFEAEERDLADDLAVFPTPPLQLADVLLTADMTCGPEGQPMPVSERLAEISARYPVDSPVHRAIRRAGPVIVAASDRVLARLVA